MPDAAAISRRKPGRAAFGQAAELFLSNRKRRLITFDRTPGRLAIPVTRLARCWVGFLNRLKQNRLLASFPQFLSSNLRIRARRRSLQKPPCYPDLRMFSRQRRRARVLFGLSDTILIALAFEAAYQTRTFLHLQRAFYILPPFKALVMSFTMWAWLLIGLWLGVYDKLDSGDPRIILRDSFRQFLYGAVALVLFEFLLRLDLSRPFLALFLVYAWTALFLFR